MSNFEPLDVRSFPLGKVCVPARSKFENVIFCSNQSQILGNTRRTFNVYLMNMFEYLMLGDVRARKYSKTSAHTRSILKKFAFDTTLEGPAFSEK